MDGMPFNENKNIPLETFGILPVEVMYLLHCDLHPASFPKLRTHFKFPKRATHSPVCWSQALPLQACKKKKKKKSA